MELQNKMAGRAGLAFLFRHKVADELEWQRKDDGGVLLGRDGVEGLKNTIFPYSVTRFLKGTVSRDFFSSYFHSI